MRPTERGLPPCGELTAPQTEGPFFKPKSPPRVSLLEKDSVGERMILAGVVLSRACKPVAKIWNLPGA